MKNIFILIPPVGFDIKKIENPENYKFLIPDKTIFDELIVKSEGYLKYGDYDIDTTFENIQKLRYDVVRFTRDDTKEERFKDVKNITMIRNPARTVFCALFTDPSFNNKYITLDI